MTAILPTPKDWPSILLARAGAKDPVDLEAAQQGGAFDGLRRAIRELGPDGTIEEIRASGLKGRGGAGHLTADKWRIYSDNIAMARWLQTTVQGMLNAELADHSLPVTDATFYKEGDPRYFWTEGVSAHDEEIALTWYSIGEPLLIHTQPNAEPNRPYGVCTVLIPALGGRLTRNGVQAKGKPWARQREGRPFSTSALAFSESWTEAR